MNEWHTETTGWFSCTFPWITVITFNDSKNQLISHAEPIDYKAQCCPKPSAWSCRAHSGQEGDKRSKETWVQPHWLQLSAFQAVMLRSNSGKSALRMLCLLLVAPAMTSGTALVMSSVPSFPLTFLSRLFFHSVSSYDKRLLQLVATAGVLGMQRWACGPVAPYWWRPDDSPVHSGYRIINFLMKTVKEP